MTEQIEVKVLKVDPRASLPTYAHTGEAGDLCADLRSLLPHTLSPGEVAKIRTGVALQFPPGFGALIEDRSGLASRGLCTIAGVIDPGFRGEVQVVIANVGRQEVTIEAGDRIAQLRIVRRIAAKFIEAADLDDSPRGARGFGSTGS